MVKLEFTELHHHLQINSLKNKYKVNPAPGVYVWGFLFDTVVKNGLITIGTPTYCDPLPTTFKGKVFIPYYTGQSSTNMFRGRLHPHMQFPNPAYPASKDLRISEFHMHDFFLDINHMNIPGNNRKNYYLTLNKNKIRYFNDRAVLQHLYPGIILPPNPLTPPDDLPLPNVIRLNPTLCIHDPLNELFTDFNNFWFTYAIPQTNPNLQGISYTDCEANVCWSLKGVTLSEVKILGDILGLSIFIDDFNLLKQGISIFKDMPSGKFPGYI